MRLVPAMLLVAGSAHADPARTLDVSGYAGVADYGHDIELGNSWAADQVPGAGVVLGGRCGITLLPDLAPHAKLDPQLGVEGELDLSMSSTGESMAFARRSFFAPVIGWRAHVIARLRTHGAIDPFLVVGGGGESVVSSSPFMADDTDAAFHWGVGFSWRTSPKWTARLDLRQGLTAGRDGGITATYQVQLGLEKSFALGEKAAPVVVVVRPPPPPPPPPDPDRDHDGIANESDRCPDDAEDRDGFQDDDGCPDPDNDGDGIADAADHCPEQAEDRDGYQDDDGCPDPDNDGDGLPDDQDQCPSQPETVNGFEDRDGCPDVLPDAVTAMQNQAITFSRGRARLDAHAKKALAAIADTLRRYPELAILVSGHADAREHAELALRRAEAVKWYLVDAGVVADRIATAAAAGAGREIDIHLAPTAVLPQP